MSNEKTEPKSVNEEIHLSFDDVTPVTALDVDAIFAEAEALAALDACLPEIRQDANPAEEAIVEPTKSDLPSVYIPYESLFSRVPTEFEEKVKPEVREIIPPPHAISTRKRIVSFIRVLTVPALLVLAIGTLAVFTRKDQVVKPVAVTALETATVPTVTTPAVVSSNGTMCTYMNAESLEKYFGQKNPEKFLDRTGNVPLDTAKPHIVCGKACRANADGTLDVSNAQICGLRP